jgi:hypothetical protein
MQYQNWTVTIRYFPDGPHQEVSSFTGSRLMFRIRGFD